ncbi:MAG: AAA family ATPase, partial [Nitrososphaerota archaeon]|nr:AAA family ATPase [Nitrososphaerota archaeon]
MKVSRIVISGVSGKIGKTLITMAIIKGLKERGLIIQPFKIGPDFIDPSYHNLFSTLPSRNLDSIMFSREVLLSSFLRNVKNVSIAIIEGMFGLYDSVDGLSERGSTAEVSKILQAPVILIIDAERINRGILAILKGFLDFDRDVEIAGIIINNVGSEKQRVKIVEAIKEKLKVMEIVGIIPRDEEIE